MVGDHPNRALWRGNLPLGNVYEDYGTLGSDGYLNLTANWVPQVHNYDFNDYSLTSNVCSQPGTPPTDNGLWQVSWGSSAASQVITVGGQEASTPATGSYLLNYQVAQVYGGTTPTNYTIRVDYYDAGSEFRLAYNITANATVHNYSPYIVPGNTNTWKTAIFTVPSAVFNGRLWRQQRLPLRNPRGRKFRPRDG